MSDNLEKNIHDAIHTNPTGWCGTKENNEQEDDWYDILEYTEKIDKDFKNTHVEFDKKLQLSYQYDISNISGDNISEYNTPPNTPQHDSTSILTDVLHIPDNTQNDTQYNMSNIILSSAQKKMSIITPCIEKITNLSLIHKVSTFTIISLTVYGFMNGNTRISR